MVRSLAPRTILGLEIPFCQLSRKIAGAVPATRCKDGFCIGVGQRPLKLLNAPLVAAGKILLSGKQVVRVARFVPQPFQLHHPAQQALPFHGTGRGNQGDSITRFQKLRL